MVFHGAKLGYLDEKTVLVPIKHSVRVHCCLHTYASRLYNFVTPEISSISRKIEGKPHKVSIFIARRQGDIAKARVKRITNGVSFRQVVGFAAQYACGEHDSLAGAKNDARAQKEHGGLRLIACEYG